MSGLVLKNINKIYPGGQHAIRDFNLEIEQGEFLVLTGTKGCGKTTLLRVIAGLEEVTSGNIFINGIDMTRTDPRGRSVAMIFRNSVLYPDMTVLENLKFALQLAKLSQEEMDERINETAELLGLASLFERKPIELTVQETYRALMGRALVRRPEILLLDIEFSDLDYDIQTSMRQEFVELRRKKHTTVICVADNPKRTMDREYRLAVMNNGELCQADTLENLVKMPKSSLVAGAVGYPPMNFFHAEVFIEGDKVGLDFHVGKIVLPEEKGEKLVAAGYSGKEVLVGVRANALNVEKDCCDTKLGKLETIFLGEEFYQGTVVLRFAIEDAEGICMTSKKEILNVGEELCLYIDIEAIQVFDRETKKTILH